jgi:KipI family sensor histidine kinase inhibitor
MDFGLYEKAHFLLAGDRGLLVEYGDGISSQINQKVRTIAMALEQMRPNGVLEIIPTYRSLLIVYEPSDTDPVSIQDELVDLEKKLPVINIPPPKTVEIPVCYGADYGPDIEFVAKENDLSVEDVIRIHSEPDYLIYMIGFTPGFPFLGGLPEILHTPRLLTPRTHVPAGSVGIANAQTGIYPIASPGGWQLIGRTPLRLFSPEKTDPFLYQTGDFIHFKPISEETYDQILQEGKT